jgi:hypothetical protein
MATVTATVTCVTRLRGVSRFVTLNAVRNRDMSRFVTHVTLSRVAVRKITILATNEAPRTQQ